MADRIAVSFAEVEQGRGDTVSTHNTINGTLGDLRGYLAPLVAEWTGSASEAYQQHQKLWDQGVAELNDVLFKISGALNSAHDHYTTAETTNTTRFR
jgi:WXG100 family type VII secretion target